MSQCNPGCPKTNYGPAMIRLPHLLSARVKNYTSMPRLTDFESVKNANCPLKSVPSLEQIIQLFYSWIPHKNDQMPYNVKIIQQKKN